MKKFFILIFLISTNAKSAVISPESVENIYLNSIGTAIEWKHDIALNIFYKDEFEQINDSINQELKLADIKDKMFFSHEIFIDYFAEDNAELAMQYGFGFNFGYQKNKLDFFTSIGFVTCEFEYESGAENREYRRNGIYYGLGSSYDLNELIALRIQTKFYEIEYDDPNGDKQKIRNQNLNLILAFNF